MGLSNAPLMRRSRISQSVSGEMCPVISASNHLMGLLNLSKMDRHCTISGFGRWNKALATVFKKNKIKQDIKATLKKKKKVERVKGNPVHLWCG